MTANSPEIRERASLTLPAEGINNYSLAISSFFVAVTVLCFCLWCNGCHHWFVVPVGLCGVVAGVDAVDWFRGRVQAFDPAGLIGLYCTFALFLAPLLHVAWDVWMSYVIPPPDWRDWLGRMGILNLAGLVAYRALRALSQNGRSLAPAKTVWFVDKRAFRVVVPVASVFTCLVQLWVFHQWGGISGFVEAFQTEEAVFEGMGWLFMISESLPMILAFALVFYLIHKTPKPSWSRLMLWIAGFVLLELVFGGLRGSRSNTVFRLFWLVGALHLLIRPIPKKLIFAGLGVVVAFMYAYGFYKARAEMRGRSAVKSDWQMRAEESGRSLQATLLGDLGRADVQAYVLYKLRTDPRDSTYAHGRTYLFAATLLIPHWILPNRPDSKEKEGSDLLWGPGTYQPGLWGSSRVFGAACEAMMNFSPFAVPLAYAVLGYVTGKLRRCIVRLHKEDVRLFLVPFGVLLTVISIGSDSDDIVFNMVSKGLIPCLVVIGSAQRVWRNQRPAEHSASANFVLAV